MKDGRLESTDLMVGDWVVYKCRAMQVSEISTELKLERFRDTDIASYNEVEPLPITQELLEKNGFEYDKFIDNLYYNDSLNDRPLFLEHANGAFEICVMNVYVKIKYVHELQHALKLCKVDKEIIL